MLGKQELDKDAWPEALGNRFRKHMGSWAFAGALEGSLRALSFICPGSGLGEQEVIGHDGKEDEDRPCVSVYEGRGKHPHLWGTPVLGKSSPAAACDLGRVLGSCAVVLSRELTQEGLSVNFGGGGSLVTGGT